MKNSFFLSTALLIAAAIMLPGVSVAELALPSWADSSQGQLEQALSSKGESVANMIAMIVGILAILGMLIGAANFSVRRVEKGKQWLGGGAVGLVVAGSVYSIASIFI